MAYTKEQVKVTLDPKVTVTVPKGTALLELAREYAHLRRETIIAARVDNDIKELTYQLQDDCSVSFIDLTEEDGMRIYRRSLYFIFMKAAYDLFPDRRVIISHAVGGGLYCELQGKRNLSRMKWRTWRSACMRSQSRRCLSKKRDTARGSQGPFRVHGQDGQVPCHRAQEQAACHDL